LHKSFRVGRKVDVQIDSGSIPARFRLAFGSPRLDPTNGGIIASIQFWQAGMQLLLLSRTPTTQP
jgi:hypothetical protein